MPNVATSYTVGWEGIPVTYMAAILIVLSHVFNALSSQTEVPEQWTMRVYVVQDGNVVSPDSDYCLMPETISVRPGATVLLEDQAGNELESGTLADPFELYGLEGTLPPGDTCGLAAEFDGVPAADGYRLEIESNATDEVGGNQTVYIGWSARSDGPFIVDYDEEGFQNCDYPSGSAFRYGMPVVTAPQPLQGTASIYPLEFASADIVGEGTGEKCNLRADVKLPVAERYELAVGTAQLSTSQVPSTPVE
jgi:hypothetical protein